jgi:hypothetical protein
MQQSSYSGGPKLPNSGILDRSCGIIIAVTFGI